MKEERDISPVAFYALLVVLGVILAAVVAIGTCIHRTVIFESPYSRIKVLLAILAAMPVGMVLVGTGGLIAIREETIHYCVSRPLLRRLLPGRLAHRA